MKTLLLALVLLGLVAALQAQDPLTFPLEELNVSGWARGWVGATP